MKAYVIMSSDTCGSDESWAVGVFKDREKAEKYCKQHSELEEFYTYWVNELEYLDDEYEEKEIKSYYYYYVGKEKPESFDVAIQYNYWETKEWLFEHPYIDMNKLEEIEKEDKLLNEVGNLSHKECIKFIKESLNESQIKEIEDYLNTPEIRWFNNSEEIEKRFYDEDLHIEEDDLSINVFSINSYNEARDKAIELYNQWLEKEM